MIGCKLGCYILDGGVRSLPWGRGMIGGKLGCYILDGGGWSLPWG